MAELGFNYPYSGAWFGLVAPVATPLPARERMAAAIHAVVHNPAFRTRTLDPLAYQPIGNTPAEFAAVLVNERQRGEALARLAGF